MRRFGRTEPLRTVPYISHGVAMTSPQITSHWPSWPLPVRQPFTVTPRQTCGYLPGRLSTFRAFHADRISGEEYQRLLDAGFRRSGSIIYQPMCARCRDCIPLRVPADRFAPTKSQRRVLRKNLGMNVTVAAPVPTQEKWELYERYQREWHKKVSPEDDFAGFIQFLYQSPVDSLEFTYRDRWDNLVGVGICDICPKSLSSVYFYFDPRRSAQSLGTYSALYEIQWAKDHQLVHWYAGYWIKECPTMNYKSRFRPCEILSTDGIWRETVETPATPAGV